MWSSTKHTGGRGLGSDLMRQLLAHPDVEATRNALVSKDAQTLYRKLGFQTHPFECMIKHQTSAQR